MIHLFIGYFTRCTLQQFLESIHLNLHANFHPDHHRLPEIVAVIFGNSIASIVNDDAPVLHFIRHGIKKKVKGSKTRHVF